MRIILALVSALFVVSVSAELAIMCDHCVDSDVAQRQALEYAPELNCHSVHSELNCTSNSERVVLIRPDTGDAYAFDVFHHSEEPWHPVVSRQSLNSQERIAYAEIAKFHWALLDTLGQRPDSISQRPIPAQPIKDAEVANVCPSQTALELITEPRRLDAVKEEIASRLADFYSDYAESGQFQFGLEDFVYSLTYLGQEYRVELQALGRKPSFVKSFDLSESASPIKDRLVFVVTLGSQHQPDVSVSWQGGSRVAGYTLASLSGQHGYLALNNPCVEQKLAQWVKDGLLEKTTTSVTLTDSCQLAEYSRGGRTLYKFRECN